MVVVDPLQRIRLAQTLGLLLVEDQCTVIAGVNAVQVDSPGAEIRHHLTGVVEHHQVVVLLHGHDGLTQGVDIDKLRLGILGGDLGEPGYVGVEQAVTVNQPFRIDLHQCHGTAGHLRYTSIARLFVAFVLNGDSDKAPIGGRSGSYTIGLSVQRAGGEYLATG